ncbi:MAG: hypothetical protein JSW48_06695 [Betaproteobacteria bacterium]|jgi:hypothetical protein|nr:MAG: hypothetical protein JSW48_06695 [Betaproteobacteria bacterium]
MMKQFFRKRSQALVAEMGWTVERAEGYVNGVMCRRRGLTLSTYHKIATDEYAQGFRTGYFNPACSLALEGDQNATAAA